MQSEVVGRALVKCRLGVVDGHWGGLPLSQGLSVATALGKAGMKLLDISNSSGTLSKIIPQGSPLSGRLHLA